MCLGSQRVVPEKPSGFDVFSFHVAVRFPTRSSPFCFMLYHLFGGRTYFEDVPSNQMMIPHVSPMLGARNYQIVLFYFVMI